MAVKARGKRLVLDFRCVLPDGRRVRCYEPTGLKDNPRGRAEAEKRWQIVRNELKLGVFDYLRHFPEGSKAKYFRIAAQEYTFSEWWDQWMAEKVLRP